MKDELIQKLEEICQDHSVVKISRLDIFFQEKLKEVKVVESNYELLKLSAEISQSISLYLMTHHYDAPKSVVELGYWLAQSTPKYRGKLSFLQMLALSLTGLFK